MQTQHHEAVWKPAEIISIFIEKRVLERIGICSHLFTSHYHNSAQNHTIQIVNKISQNTVMFSHLEMTAKIQN
jgi:hypothetical protein